MSKLVVLRLDGDLEREGLRVTLEISSEGGISAEQPPYCLEINGKLPPDPNLATRFRDWQQHYRRLDRSYRRGYRRIEPIRINYQGSIRDLISNCQTSAEHLEQQFNTWLKSLSFLELECILRSELNKEEAIRFVIRTADRMVQKLPWHSWNLIEHYPQAEIGLGAFDYCSPPSPRPLCDRLRILGIFGYSSGIDIERDKQMLTGLDAEVCLLENPQLNQLNDQLWEQHWDIIFFAGHGETTEENEGRIYINETESISIDRIWYGLRRAVESGLQLAIFNSCDGLGLLARQINDPQIPHTIVMRDLVPDRVAQVFLEYFLTAFSQGKSLYLAAREARERLQGMENEYPCASWLPIIWQNPAAVPFAWPSPSRSPRNPLNLKILGVLGVLALGCFVGYRLFGPPSAKGLNQLGIHQHEQGRLLVAQRHYRLAALLDRNNAAPHYNLGWLCDESFQDRDCAIRAYERATRLGRADAAAELARLRALQGDYDEALGAIYHCLQQRDYLQEYPAIAAACLKNRGWVRWEQGRWGEAETDLKEAIALEFDSPHAHCLLARILEARGEPEAALEHWQIGLQGLEYNVPEQDRCIDLAHQRLQK
ncbi:MAG: tetratricopeptide repeat protein [Cyanobacteria bacterium SBLK]|nr:tetratricopeptide repeat protein [Cyanobacteria bacterium SBLK]